VSQAKPEPMPFIADEWPKVGCGLRFVMFITALAG
jgi:hypothetical protein